MKTRILTALAAIPFALGVVFYLPNEAFAVFVILILGLGAWEWGGFLRVSTVGRFFYLALLVLGYVAAWCQLENQTFLLWMLRVAAIWWVLATLWVLVFPRGFGNGEPNRLMVAITGALVLVPTFVAIVTLQGREGNGPWQLMVVVSMMWAADSGAYFAGRFLGKHKLAPKVSPGKTWEGVLGGVLAGMVIVIVGGVWIYSLAEHALYMFAIFGFVVIMLSVIGDLTESMFKRATDIKDSGTLFPGHGGIMDRIDSLTASAPCYLLGLHYLSLA